MASKEELESARRAVQIKEIERKSKIAAWNDYVSFVSSKIGGVGAVICGGLDVLNPSLIPHLPHPERILGAGLTLLTGKSVLTIIAKALKASGIE